MTAAKQPRARAGKAAASPAQQAGTRSPWARPGKPAGTGSTAGTGRGPARTAAAPVMEHPPQPVRIATWLMYAGAVLSGVNLIAALLTSGSERAALHAANPAWDASLLTEKVREYMLYVGVTWALAIGLWLIMARTNLAGRGWARMAASVLCALDTLTLIRFLTLPSSALSKLLVIPMWLAGAGAIVALWQRPSSAWIRSRAGA
jgi:hypothetical protein